LNQHLLRTVIVTALALMLTVAGAQEPTFDNLHVPSPEWRDQVIYFIMIDRFNDGDPSNNDQGAGEYDPDDNRKFQGGDLQGIIDQLDYIEGLGATTVWITPPVANQWWDPLVQYGGYHGYWASDFTAVDPHFGTLETYQALSDALHDRGMYLIQDIVTNHTGNFYSYDGPYKPDDPTANFILNTESVPVTAPALAPLDQNDITNPDHRAAALYNWTPVITDYDDRSTRETYQLADLDDLNTTNPVVRDLLREAYGDWIRDVGVDGFRIDTVIYVEHDFWNDFVQGPTGMNAVAAETGREDFLTFGEAFRTSEPFTDAGDREVASYLGTPEQPELASMIHFPLFATINRVFGEGAPTAEMTYRLQVTQDTFPDPTLLPTFIDNHDVARFLGRNGYDALKQALAFLFTSPGIPVVYYGTEQGFVEDRASMFAGGAGSGGEDHFDTDADLYRWIADLSALRSDHPALTRGALDVLMDSDDAPGLFAYQRTYAGESVVVLMNTTDQSQLFQLGTLDDTLKQSRLEPILSTHASPFPLMIPERGNVGVGLLARQVVVYAVQEDAFEPLPEVEYTVDTTSIPAVVTEPFTLTGTYNGPDFPLRIAVNGNDPLVFNAAPDGTWAVTVPVDALPSGPADNTLIFYVADAGSFREPITFRSDIQRVVTGSTRTVSDPVGDDSGPAGAYGYPTDDTFTAQMDIHEVTVAPDGADLAVSLTMGDTSDVWNPVNGFDHVLFSIFVDVPGRDGVTVLPRLNANAPDGFAWDAFAFVEGWNNRIYTADGASADLYGTPATLETAIAVDMDANRITITIPGDVLGNTTNYDDIAVYITTWDWDGVGGNYRGLGASPAQWNMSGGDFDADPLIMDDVLVPAGP
jgi:glycosidase